MENSYKRDDDDDIDSRGFLKFYFVKITCTKITIILLMLCTVWSHPRINLSFRGKKKMGLAWWH